MTLDRTVLIADDDPQMLQALALRCGELGLDVSNAENGLIAIIRARKNPPDLMIVDIEMPEADGLKVCERLLKLNIVFPVIVLTGSSNAETIGRCEAVGAHYVLKDSRMWERLEVLIPRLLRSSDPKESGENNMAAPREYDTTPGATPKVLAIDDDSAITRAIKIRLQYHGVETLEATNGMQGYMIALKEKPDVIITDYNMPEGSGDHLLVRLNQSRATRSIPVIVMTGQTIDGRTNVALQRDVLGRRGASAFLTKPLDFEALAAELGRHVKLVPIKQLAGTGS